MTSEMIIVGGGLAGLILRPRTEVNLDALFTTRGDISKFMTGSKAG